MLEIQKKTQIRPIVEFPLATEFNERVAMDLKQWSYQEKGWLIHIVDHLKRYSASCVIQSKRKGVIVESIFKTWIAIFVSPKSFLVDIGGEFNNSEFISFCENFSINIKRTATAAQISKEILQVSLTIFLSKSWSLNSINIESAFLQGKEINRELYLKPPKDFARERKVWLLKKTVYGLSDTSKSWYTRVKEELLKLNVKISKYDPGLFMYQYRGTLHGLLVTHVDDFLWRGTHILVENVIKPLHKIFKIGSVNKKAFPYLGFERKEKDSSIVISQSNYVDSVESLKLYGKKDKNDLLNEREIHSLRALIGHFNWLATQTRPDILFQCCDLLVKIKSPTTDDPKRANKLVNKIKSEETVVTLKNKDNLADSKLLVCCDASFANMSGGGSQARYTIFWSDTFGNNIHPIAWQSHRIKRILNSTLEAEAMGLIEASGKAFWIRCIINEIFPTIAIPVIYLTDSKTQYHAVKSSKQIADKRFSIDLATIKEKCENKEIENIIWISKEKQIADSLTKKVLVVKS